MANPPDDADRSVVRAAALLLVDTALRLIQDDPHDWSERPCPTCRPISSIVGRPFGCYAFAETERARRLQQATKPAGGS